VDSPGSASADAAVLSRRDRKNARKGGDRNGQERKLRVRVRPAGKDEEKGKDPETSEETSEVTL